MKQLLPFDMIATRIICFGLKQLILIVWEIGKGMAWITHSSLKYLTIQITRIIASSNLEQSRRLIRRNIKIMRIAYKVIFEEEKNMCEISNKRYVKNKRTKRKWTFH